MRAQLKRQDTIVLIFAGILIAIVFAMAFLSFQDKPAKNTAAIVPSIQPTRQPTTQLPTGPLEKYSITYDTTASQKLWRKVDNNDSLSDTDALAKNELVLSRLGGLGEGGVVYQTPDVTVDYVRSLDLFQATITTTGLESAKKETVAWFRSYGISEQGICNLPLMFSIDLFTAQELKGQNITFDPLPPGCQ